jgi:hypothetical protein
MIRDAVFRSRYETVWALVIGAAIDLGQVDGRGGNEAVDHLDAADRTPVRRVTAPDDERLGALVSRALWALWALVTRDACPRFLTT